MKLVALTIVGVLLSFGAWAFAPNMPTIYRPNAGGGGGGGGGGAPAQCTSLVYNLSTGITDIGRFSRVFVTSGC